jgi:DNA-binding GntR family transcriptional regulator
MVSQSRAVSTAPATTTLGERHLPLSRAVLDELRAAIIGGDYAQGARLVEEDIASRFDVSRNPIREALHTLSAEGFVVLEPRKGARVASIDATRAAELFELRGPLEGLVAGLAAERREARDVARLRAVLATGRRAVAEDRPNELPVLNTEFHGILADAAKNELLRGTLARLSDIIRWVYSTRISQRSARSWDEHAAIVDAVADGDVERARRCGEDHIAAAAAAYQAVRAR